MVKVTPVILCGGSGTRLWPLSTPDRPKQFLALTSDQPMIVETANRFSESHSKDLSFQQIMVVGSEKHRSLLREALPDARLILEPFGRNSAPAVAAVSLAHQPEDLLLILPADHSITNIPAFHAAIASGIAAAQGGNIVTFGLKPSYAATGYGYIQAVMSDEPAYGVSAFVEKPERPVAEQYIAAGNYFWNAGIFLFRAGTMLDALRAHAPDVLPPVKAAMGSTISSPTLLQAEYFSKAPDISIDYAVMEHASNVKVVPVEMGWSDVGDYQALHDLFCEGSSTVVTKGPTIVQNSKHIYANSQGPVIAVSGVEDLNVIATPDTVMVTKAGDSAAVKALGQAVKTNRRNLGLSESLISETWDWLWSTFDYWADRAWDKEMDGFVEQVGLDGVPDLSSPRRVRVQARQVFSFARALQYGWANKACAEHMVEQGLSYIDEKLRHPDGGWVHIVDRVGQPIDSKRDLYDHAFIILAGAAAYEAMGAELGLSLAQEALGFINQTLKAGAGQGWYEGVPASLPRRANPHMHLLEANLALYRATGDSGVLGTAKECVTLFEAHFFDPSADILGEFFKEDWSPQASTQETVFEPGHMYEWAALLCEYDRLTGHDSLSWRRRLIRTADHHVRAQGIGVAMNAQRLDGVTVNPNRRLWPQLEMLRAHLLHPGVAPHGTAERVFGMIKQEYLDKASKGLWVDEFDESGKACTDAAPASMLYHFITAFESLL